MKVGSPITYAGRTGTVTSLSAHVAHCIDASGKRFIVPRKKRGPYRKASRPIEVLVPGYTDWLAAEWISPHQVRITAPDPIWYGAKCADSTVKVRTA